MSITETDDWKLGLFMEWRPKHKVIDCPMCKGKGTIGGGFKDMDDERPCTECFGTRIKKVPPSSIMPELPADLVEHMRRAWYDFNNRR